MRVESSQSTSSYFYKNVDARNIDADTNGTNGVM